MLLVQTSEVKSRDVVMGALHWWFLIPNGWLLLLATYRDFLSYDRFFLLTRKWLLLCSRVFHFSLLAEYGRHSWHVILAVLSAFSPSWLAVLIRLATHQLIESSAILSPFGEVSSYWLLIRKAWGFNLSWWLFLSLYAQNLTKLLLIFGLSQKFIEIVSQCINIQKLGVTHPWWIDRRIVLQVVGLTKMLKTMFLWRTQHFLSCHPVPFETFLIFPSSYLSSLYASFNLHISLAVTIHLRFALFLFGLRQTECISLWFYYRSRLRGRAKRKLLIGHKRIWFRLWVRLLTIVFIGVNKRLFGSFDGPNRLGRTFLRLLLILLFQRIDHLGEDVAIRQERVIHIFKQYAFAGQTAQNV